MTAQESINIIDLVLKGSVAIILSVGGYMAKKASDDIEKLTESKQVIIERVSTLEANALQGDKRLERIEDKIDRILEIAR